MHQRRAQGFTLLEVLVALFIIAGAIVVINNTWSGSTLRMRKTAQQYDVATLLERKMIETEVKYKDKPLNEIPEEEGGDFGSDFPKYRWTLKSKDLKFPDLAPLMIGQEDGASEEMITMIRQMTDFLSQSIREVQITVYVKGKSREVPFSATQYFVDYNKPFGGGAGGPGQ
jgi:general secretion pathway protein I